MIKNEKDLAKQAKLEEKRRIKEEKDLAKQIRLEEKRLIKEEKKLSRKKIAKNGKNKYCNLINETIISKYIIKKSLGENAKLY